MRHPALRATARLLVLLLSIPAAADGAERDFHIRAADTWVEDLLSIGRAASPTFASLADAIAHSDVIVHVEEEAAEEGRSMGRTRFVARAAGVRYLRVSIRRGLPVRVAVVLLAHELQHVSEIAQATWVSSEPDVAQLYAQIGRVRVRDGIIEADTAAAWAIGERVRSEIRRRRESHCLSPYAPTRCTN